MYHFKFFESDYLQDFWEDLYLSYQSSYQSWYIFKSQIRSTLFGCLLVIFLILLFGCLAVYPWNTQFQKLGRSDTKKTLGANFQRTCKMNIKNLFYQILAPTHLQDIPCWEWRESIQMEKRWTKKRSRSSHFIALYEKIIKFPNPKNFWI
jgi:hypothetical protein